MSCAACLAMILCCASPDAAAASIGGSLGSVLPAGAATLTLEIDPAAAQFALGGGAGGGPAVVALHLQDTGAIDQPSFEPPTAAPEFGSKGDRRLYFQGGAGVEVSDGDNIEGFLGVGMEWFVVERFSISTELNAWYFDQVGDNAFGGNFNLLVRYHLILEDAWSFYVDGGAGVLLTTEDVPFNGTSFNFTPQAGAGFTFDIGDQNRLMIGVRWHHISNASLSDSNPGRDSILGYAGISLPF